jgi:two-component sensor histidine kinase
VNPVLKSVLVFIGFTAIGLLNVGIRVTNDLASGDPVMLFNVVVEELSGVYTFLLLLPFPLWFMAKFPLTRGNWYYAFPAHVGVTLVFGFSHTTLMGLSRSILFHLLDMGPYYYGNMDYRYLMEYQKQFIAYWLVYGLVAWRAYDRRMRERERRTAELEVRAAQLDSRLAESRLQSLRTQVHPHFLFNTLNMISSVMYEDPRTADTMIAHLSALLRSSLELDERNRITLAEETAVADQYVAIMRARFGDNLQVQTRIDSSCRTALVPPMILQPLIENSIKHFGSGESIRTMNIRITARCENRHLVLCVEDNGPGLSASLEDHFRNGTGLSNIAARLDHLYGQDHRFEAFNRPQGGLTVEVRVPYERAGDESRTEKTHDDPQHHR